MKKTVVVDNEQITLENLKEKNREVSFDFEGESHQLKVLFQDHEKIYFYFNGNKIESYYYFEKGRLFLDLNGKSFISKRMKFELKKSSGGNEGDQIISPMPGKITKVFVTEGQEVKEGETLAVMEAMKMEHSLKSPKDGVVSKIIFNEGTLVEGQVELIVVEEIK